MLYQGRIRTTLCAALCTLLILNGGCGAPSPEQTVTQQKQAEDFKPKWKEVSAIVVKSGGTVDPFDPERPYTMRIIMPGETSTHQARKTAKMIRERLHEKAVVYVYDDTRKRLARADAYGTSD
jgi:hypothetical protein